MKLLRILSAVIGIALLVGSLGCSTTPAEVAPTSNIDATVEVRAKELVATQPTATPVVVIKEVTPTDSLIPTATPTVPTATLNASSYYNEEGIITTTGSTDWP